MTKQKGERMKISATPEEVAQAILAPVRRKRKAKKSPPKPVGSQEKRGK